MEVLLSFCIPTYNRKLYLRETIISLVKEIESASACSKINICISDNSSTDGTHQMIKDLINTLSVEIIYSKNDENIGFDLNVIKAVSLSNAKYCWLFGSDDQLAPNAISLVLNKITAIKPAELFLCARIECNYRMQPIRQDDILNTKITHIDTANQKELSAYFYSCKRLTGCFSFISELIFLKSSWDKQKFNQDFVGLVYSHVYMILSMIKIDKIKIVVLPEYLVYCRLNDDIIRSEGLVSRILLDLDGYAKFANYFFSDQKLIYASFVNIVRKEHSIGTILYLKKQTTSEIWKAEIAPRLKELQYNKLVITLIGFSTLTAYLVRVVNFGVRKLIKN